ncbi:MAG TPA: hypothetical protein VF881_02965 [Polyangiaceae bacterium]
MPHSDPPPRPDPHAEPESVAASAAPPGSEPRPRRDKDADPSAIEISIGHSELSPGEVDILLDDLAADGPEPGADPRPSPFDRITIIPDMTEEQYVAKMMSEAAEYDAPPARAEERPAGARSTSEAPTVRHPSGGALADVDSGWSWPPDPTTSPTVRAQEGAPENAAATDVPAPPLTLDLSEAEAAEAKRNGELPAPAPVVTVSNGPLSFGAAAGDALELVQVRAQSIKPAGSSGISLREVRDRFDVGDFSGALVLAEGILEHDPESVDAVMYAEHCRDVLKQMYVSRLGSLRSVPRVAVNQEQLRWLALDHRAGFLLSLVDGRSTFEEVLDMSGMPDFEALRLLMQLLQQNVIKM